MRFYQPALLFSLALLCLQSPAQADEKELGLRLKNCRAIPSMITRAQCYDLVIADFDLENMNKIDVSGGSGKWRVTTDVAAISGDKSYFASIVSDDYTRSSGGKYTRPSLVIRCAEGKMEGYVIWDEVLGETDTTINFRLDDGDVVAEKWALSGDLQASFIPDAEDFTKKLLPSSVLNIKTWPIASDPMVGVFDLRGANNALTPLIENCTL